MKRPIQHILEEESRSAFSQIVPHGWVKNDFVKDYGKDIHLEIFRKFESTGNTFSVQLKATQRPIKNNASSVDLEVSKLKYYASLDNPVLLVLYSSQTKQFWAIWANRILDEYEPKENKKSLRINLGKDNLINEDFFVKLETTFNKDIAFKMNLAIEEKGSLAQLMAYRLKGWCQMYFPGTYELNNPIFPHKVYVSIIESQEGLEMKIQAKKEHLVLEKMSTLNSVFLYSKLLLENKLEKEELELVFAMSTFFSEYNPQQAFKLLSAILHQYNGKLKTPASLQSIADFAISNNLKHELQVLIENSIKARLANDFQILNSVLVQKNEMLDNYLSNLLLAFETFAEHKLRGTFAYNIGNYYRSRRSTYLAVKYLMIAKQLEPSYLERYYWWHDLAGVLFSASHDLLAEQFYRKAIELDKDSEKQPLTFALLADCLFFQAKFDQAYVLYNKFCKEVILGKEKMPLAEYSFKGIVCPYLIERGLNNVKLDRNGSILECSLGIESNSKASFERSIFLYPLNYHSWYALAHLYRSDRDYDNTYYAFLVAALILLDNKRTWIECLISSFQIEQKEMSTTIFFLMIELLGDVTLNELILTIQQIPEITDSDKSAITDEFVQLFDTYKKSIETDIYKPPYIEFRFSGN